MSAGAGLRASGESEVNITGPASLAGRLRAIAPYLLVADLLPPHPDPATDAAILVEKLVDAVSRQPTTARVWLLYVAVAARFPDEDEVIELKRRLELSSLTMATIGLLDSCAAMSEHWVRHGRRIRMVVDSVVVDVDHAARYDSHTGIQQVVRRAVPYWCERGAILAAWTRVGRGMRSLDAVERARVIDWSGPVGRDPNEGPSDEEAELIVPWRSVVMMLDAPRADSAREQLALASLSGNSLVVIGHDCIPVISPQFMPVDAADVFARFLAVVKHARRIAAVSESVRAEFGGFSQALQTQGMAGPKVFSCPLPTEPVRPNCAPPQTGALPMILAVGSFEPRKNHIAILHAAERLWREGHRFKMLLIGGAHSDGRVFQRVAELNADGRDVEVRQAVPLAELEQAMKDARFVVFPSLHEGFGLPIVEAFTHDTPVLTANFGSTAEIAAAGGALVVDPHDDAQLLSAMRSLLTDDGLITRLRAEIRSRPTSSWDDYASEIWERLVLPVLVPASESTAR